MDIRFLCSFVILIVLEFLLACEGQSIGDPGVCMRPINVEKTKYITVRCRKAGRIEKCRRIHREFVTEMKPACCKGWVYSISKCTPECTLGCNAGTCIAPDTCDCTAPLVLKNNNTCEEPVCDPHCVNADCVEDDRCLCKEGFKEYNATHCAPICPEGFINDPLLLDCKPQCDKCINGNCTAPNTCTCAEGFTLQDSTCIPVCKVSCTNGKCVAPNTCECKAGYNIDSSNKSVCNPICENACVNATCVEPNKCSCISGYEYSNEWICKPKCDSCNYGECVGPNQCRCLDGYFKADGVSCSPVCDTTCLNSYCSAPNVCSCNEGYELNSKDKFKCEPICRNGCVNGTCSSPDSCTCYPGFKRLNRSACTPLCTSCEHGVCVSPEDCQCNLGFNRINGTCKPVCSSPCVNGFCESPDTCACNDGYTKNLIKDFCYKPCIGECENGICNHDGQCICNPGYELFNNSCITPDDCNKCSNKTCDTSDCRCDDGRPCLPPKLLPEDAARSTSLAGLQLTWVLGGCLGILLVTVVIATIGYMWRKRKEYVGKPTTDHENVYQSVLYTVPNTLIQSNYNENREDSLNENDEEDINNQVSVNLLEATDKEDEKIPL